MHPLAGVVQVGGVEVEELGQDRLDGVVVVACAIQGGNLVEELQNLLIVFEIVDGKIVDDLLEHIYPLLGSEHGIQDFLEDIFMCASLICFHLGGDVTLEFVLENILVFIGEPKVAAFVAVQDHFDDQQDI